MFISSLRCAVGALGLYAPLALAGTDIIVSKTDDRFDPDCKTNCSLREAIHQANQQSGAQRIVLRAGTYHLTLDDPVWNPEEEPDADEDQAVHGDLDIRGDIVLIGAGQQATLIEGTRNRLIDVLPGATLELRRLTLKNGYTLTDGGALRNNGETMVREVSFLDNRAKPGLSGRGGAIANFASLSVSHSLFRGNNSNGDEGLLGLGGAIYNEAELLVRDSDFDANSVTDNDVDYARGGAIYNIGLADVARSTFRHGRAGEYAGGGGGSAIVNDKTGVFKLTNSTLSGNSGTEVNGVVSNGISAYTPSGTQAQMQLINVTIADNAGLGLSNLGTLLIRNSLIAGNHLQGMPANCANQGSYQARGLLLGSDQGNCSSDVPVDDSLTLRKIIYPLADNKGSTFTHALRPASPAVDAGVGSCTRHDQRAITRPRDGDGDGMALCDLGAYERVKP